MPEAIVPRWASADEYQLQRLLERKAAHEDALRQKVRNVAAEIHYNGMSVGDLEDSLVEKANAVTEAVAPYQSGPYKAVILDTGEFLPFHSAGLTVITVDAWHSRAVLNAMVATGDFFTDEELDETSQNMDEHGNSLSFRETMTMMLNVATIVRNRDGEGYIIIRIPQGEA